LVFNESCYFLMPTLSDRLDDLMGTSTGGALEELYGSSYKASHLFSPLSAEIFVRAH